MHSSSSPARALRLMAVALVVTGFVQQAWGLNKCTTKDGLVVYQDALCSNDFAAATSVKVWPNSLGGRRSTQPDTQLSGPSQATALMGIYRRWIDAERLALNTSRVALAGPVAAMQALQRETEVVPVASCLIDAKQALLVIVSKSTEALLRFMGKDEVSGMAYQLLDRPKLIPAFESAVSGAKCG